MRDRRWLVLGALLTVAACAGSAPGEITYHQHAAPILSRYCVDCHSEGGIAPFALPDYGAARDHAFAMRSAVESGSMPPWLASDAGLPLRHSRKLRPEDRELLLRWIDGGALQGDAGAPPRIEVPAAETVEPPRPDLRLDPGVAYQPNVKRSDDYRCFVVHDELPRDLYVQAAAIRPGQPSVVHHVIVFEVPAAGVAKVRSRLGQDGHPGYDCFGGAGSDSDARVLMAWAPGAVAARFPPNTALKVGAGSLLVMQVHYNLINRRDVADRTTAELELLPGPPPQLAQIWPIADPQGLYIKAGDPAARQTIRLEVWLLEAYYQFPAGNLLLHGVAPHMHLRGKRQTVAIDNGPLLLEVPRWDFHWQLPYRFQTPVELRPQDTIVLECEFDNSVENQPLQDGVRMPPRDLRWGEGTTDEMCLNFLYVTPTSAAP
jgi:hypothetical protein